MKNTLKIMSAILVICVLIGCFMSSGFAFDMSKFDELLNSGIITQSLFFVLDDADDDEEIVANVYLEYDDDIRDFRGSENFREEMENFYTSENTAFAEKLPESVKVTHISAYAPIVEVTAVKADIYKIAKMEHIDKIREGEKHAYGGFFQMHGFTFDPTKYVDGLGPELIKGLLPQMLEQANDEDEIDVTLWISYTEEFDKSQYAPDKVAEGAEAFFCPRNEAFVKTLPENVKVTFISSYAPVVDLTVTKADIYKIAEIDAVFDMWEGSKYTIYEDEDAPVEPDPSQLPGTPDNPWITDESYRFGDLNGDGKVTSADARICLQAAAGLIELSEQQWHAANFTGESNFKPTSGTARKILRAAAKIDALDNITVHMYETCGFVLGPLKNAGSGKYNWVCEVSSDKGLKVSETTVNNAPAGTAGQPVEQTFEFYAEETGEYDVTLKLIASDETEPIDEISFKVVVDLLPPVMN